MPIMTMACIHNHYAACNSKLCECECHKPKDAPNRTAELREAAHQAVKAFDHSPNWDNTCLAVLALEEYQDQLRRERNG